MQRFTEKTPTLDNYWRAIILFGRNVASYKFALGKSLLQFAAQGTTQVPLTDLAEPFALALCEHLRHTDKQATSKQSRFLDACRAFNRGDTDKDRLVATTVQLGFSNVIDAFHVVGDRPTSVRFFADERQGRNQGIRLTDDLLRLHESFQVRNLGPEVEARWRLVETAWSLGLPPHLLSVDHNSDSGLLVVLDSRRARRAITASRQALNGYQKGKCFYCSRPIAVDDPTGGAGPDVDHFFPHRLKGEVQWNVDGVWNLVLACAECNRGPAGKFALIPDLPHLQRLHARNEWLISSYHPLRETIMTQTGATEMDRRNFLALAHETALGLLIHTWAPSDVDEPGL